MATMAEAKRDFARGSIGQASVIYAPLFDVYESWVIRLSYTNPPGGVAFEFLVDARSKQPRQFKTLDSAHNALRAIGFLPLSYNINQ